MDHPPSESPEYFVNRARPEFRARPSRGTSSSAERLVNSRAGIAPGTFFSDSCTRDKDLPASTLNELGNTRVLSERPESAEAVFEETIRVRESISETELTEQLQMQLGEGLYLRARNLQLAGRTAEAAE